MFAAMNDEWRLQIDVQDDARATKIGEHLAARELEHDLSDAFADRVIVSRDGTRLFVYAGSREQVESAGELIVRIAGEEGWTIERRLRRWHPAAVPSAYRSTTHRSPPVPPSGCVAMK